MATIIINRTDEILQKDLDKAVGKVTGKMALEYPVNILMLLDDITDRARGALTRNPDEENVEINHEDVIASLNRLLSTGHHKNEDRLVLHLKMKKAGPDTPHNNGTFKLSLSIALEFHERNTDLQ